MKKSHRAKRMNKRHNRRSYTAPIMLTSLMDIFTVLVVFLLASSSTGQQLPNNNFITLPESFATSLPRTTLVIQVSEEGIIVQGVKVANTKDVMASDKPYIPALVKALDHRASLVILKNTDDNPARKVKIMGDRHIPFSLLKKVMVSCTKTIYTEISFAVLMKARKEAS